MIIRNTHHICDGCFAVLLAFGAKIPYDGFILSRKETTT